jgi:hypothetical protein
VQSASSAPDDTSGGVQNAPSAPDDTSGGVQNASSAPDATSGGVQKASSAPDAAFDSAPQASSAPDEGVRASAQASSAAQQLRGEAVEDACDLLEDPGDLAIGDHVGREEIERVAERPQQDAAIEEGGGEARS